MPIRTGIELRRMDDEEFKQCTYDVLRHVFAIHNELGRLFHEKIYQRELAFRVTNAQCEVPIHVQFESFCKTYLLDLVVAGGAIFEMKAASSLADIHRRQLMHYLFLTDLPHGVLVNTRPERVEHEFVNNVVTVSDRTVFDVVSDDWQEMENQRLKDGMIAALRDWGTGLDLGLYEDVAQHLCGQSPNNETEVEVRLGARRLGVQATRLIAPRVALRVASLPTDRQPQFFAHLRRFLQHTNLDAIQWINVAKPLVQFVTVRKRK